MAKVDVSVSSDMTPDEAWALASDLNRFDEWLTIFGGWRSEVPDEIKKGTRVSSCIKVKGFRNTIRWEVTQYDAPSCIEMKGSGFGGVRIDLNLTISDKQPGSEFHLHADLHGGVLSGPVGKLVARVLKSDVRKSVENLSRLQGSKS
ncbi:MAG TPA: SRPBCC family protein [Mycobacterium sp.]|nr:SRPBCC family protein [Mycobacterium sp.]